MRVIVATLVASLAAGLFGFDTGSIGAITEMQAFVDDFGHLSPTLRGVVVAVILLPSAFVGMTAGNVADKLSRKYAIALGAVIFAIGSAISAGATSLGMLIGARCLAGIGEGLFLPVGGVYLAELSPKHLRPHMMLLYQVYNAGGVTMGFFVCYGSANIPNSMGWRFPFVLQTFSAVVLAVGCLFMPFSPRWLLTQGRREEAEAVLIRLVGPEHAAERRELLSVPAAQAAARTKSQLDAMREIWEPGVRGRTILGLVLNVFMQLSGIDFDPSTSSFIASGCTGIILTIGTVVGSFYIDKVGRRKIWIWGGICIALSQLVLGVFYATKVTEKSQAGKYAVIVFIELFALAFTMSWSLITKLYAAEIQPNRTRAAATSFGIGTNQLANFCVAVSGPAFLASSSYGPYFAYGSFSAVGAFFGWVFMYEVRGESLEKIDEIFEGSPIAISWPAFLRPTQQRLTVARRRRNSRHKAATLPSPGVIPDGVQLRELGNAAAVEG
ncbi:hypothetical protein Rhopal_002312-T1 [Rhodotorula paludigena]|uniref:Major facilitator superfamily (MFS) profile domain-containing protein n=1 Tax=Rhodotorula paludigena TaxID=86838 RepID=A0AAV5GJV8_9BASI|nr:hypothetical protein Rhopal_002312-T1 [Rhodotorula paludigena]